MKSFLDHLKEEVLPTVQVADGGLDIDKPAVRAAINAAIAGVTSQPAVTPYVVFNRLSKLLAQYHIILPRKFLEGDKGVEVFEIRQFGHRMGMTDSGEFVNEVPSTHYLFLQYGILSPFGITYAKPVVGGMFRVMARLVDKEELDKLLDMAEITMSEEAECMQAMHKANAPKEEMKDVTDDPKKVGNKKVVATSEKKSLDEERKNSSTVTKAFAAGKKVKMKTLQSHGTHVTYHGNKIASHHDGEVHLTAAGYGHSPSTRGHLNSLSQHFGGERFSQKKGQLHYGDKPIASDEVVKIKRSTVSEEEKKPYRVGATKKDKGGRTVERRDYSTHSVIVATHDKEGKSLQNKWGGHNPDRVGKPNYIKKHFDKMEEEKNDLKDACWKGYTAKGLKKKGNRMVPNCVPVEEENIEEGQVTGPRSYKGSSDRNRKAVQMNLGRKHKDHPDWNERTNPQHSALTLGRKLQKQGIVREDTLDELRHDTIKAYRDERKRDVKVTNISASHSEDMAKHHKVMGNEKKSKEFGDEAKWLRGKQKKMKAGIKLADKKMTGKARVNASMKEEKGDRLIPGFSNRKDFEAIAKDIGTGQGGTTIVPKGNTDDKFSIPPMSQKSSNRVSREGSKNEYGEGGSLQEKLTKKMSAGSVIHDFVHSKSKTFKGDTKKERIKRALGAYYGMHKEEKKEETVLVSPKGYKGGGKVTRIRKKDYDPKKHSLASE
jgi:hypothetical protein